MKLGRLIGVTQFLISRQKLARESRAQGHRGKEPDLERNRLHGVQGLQFVAAKV